MADSIDWGQLSPIAGSKVIASVAPRPDDSLNSLAGGIMSGIQQGQQIQASNQAIAASKQDMAQKAALFPETLRNEQGIANQNQAKGQADMRSEAGIQSFINASKQGHDAATKAIMAVDPVGGIKMQQDYADLQQKQAAAAGEMAKTRGEELKILPQLQISVANTIQSSVSLATDPKTGQIDLQKANQIYQQQLMPIAKNTPDILTAFPPQLDAGSAANAVAIGNMAHARMAQDYLTTHPSKGTNFNQLQTERDALQSQISAAGANATPQQKQDLQEMNQKLTSTPGVETTMAGINKQVSIDSIKASEEITQKNQPILANLDAFEAGSKLFNTGAVAETDARVKAGIQGMANALGIKIPTNAGAAESLNSITAQMKLELASQVKNARMSAPMLQVVGSIPPKLENTPQGNQMVADRLKYILTTQNAFNDFQQQYAQQNQGSIFGVDRQWKKFLDSAPVFNKDGTANVQHLQDDSSAFLDPKYTPPKVAQPAVNSTQTQNQGQPSKTWNFNIKTGKLE